MLLRKFLHHWEEEETVGSWARGTRRHTHDLPAFENLNSQLRKSQSRSLLYMQARRRGCARVCKDALIRRGKIKAELWVRNRSNRQTFFVFLSSSSFFFLPFREKKKQFYFWRLMLFLSLSLMDQRYQDRDNVLTNTRKYKTRGHTCKTRYGNRTQKDSPSKMGQGEGQWDHTHIC